MNIALHLTHTSHTIKSQSIKTIRGLEWFCKSIETNKKETWNAKKNENASRASMSKCRYFCDYKNRWTQRDQRENEEEKKWMQKTQRTRRRRRRKPLKKLFVVFQIQLSQPFTRDHFRSDWMNVKNFIIIVCVVNGKLSHQSRLTTLSCGCQESKIFLPNGRRRRRENNG